MKTILHKASTRGHADHGWLNTWHTFSFADYYNPERISFGALRVLNDDTVKGGMGFGRHPHRDMEIVSIPLSGALEHGDSMGNSGIIRKGEVQVMSAGTGITHSEKNASNTEEVKFLQIWILPRQQGVEPRYGQMQIDAAKQPNEWRLIVSPNPESEGLWIHQDAWFYRADMNQGASLTYRLNKKGNGAYLFVIEGSVDVGRQTLNRRDGLGITEADTLDIQATANAEILVIEVPMN